MWCLLSSGINVTWFSYELLASHCDVTPLITCRPDFKETITDFALFGSVLCILLHPWVLSVLHHFHTVSKQEEETCAYCWRHVRGSRCLAPLILNLGTAWRSAVNITFRGRTSTIHWIWDRVGLRAGWTGIVPQIYHWINNFYENLLHYLHTFGAYFVHMILK
jgi:hypothetical protein